MTEKQTYTPNQSNNQYRGPQTETHINIETARTNADKTARRSFGRGALIGAGAGGLIVAGAALLAPGMGNHGSAEAAAPTHDAEPTKTSAPSYEHVTVQPGDTMWEIAERIDSHSDPRDTIESLEKINPNVTPESIQPGEILNVPINLSHASSEALPSAPASAEAAPKTIVTNVGEGDSIEGIASSYYPSIESDTAVDAIEEVNPNKDPDEFYEWKTANIPAEINGVEARDLSAE